MATTQKKNKNQLIHFNYYTQNKQRSIQTNLYIRPLTTHKTNKNQYLDHYAQNKHRAIQTII